MDQANQPPSGEKSTLQVSHPARPSRDGGRLVFSSRISAGSDAGEEERRGNMNSAGDRFIFPWQVSGSYLPLSFPIFLPPSPLGRACFLEVSPGTAAWLRSVAMTAWPSSDIVLNKSGTYMSLVAPRCFPWSTSCPSFTFFALWLTSRKRRPCLRRLCHVRTQLGLCVVTPTARCLCVKWKMWEKTQMFIWFPVAWLTLCHWLQLFHNVVTFFFDYVTSLKPSHATPPSWNYNT